MSDRPINHEDLLRKYMRYVGECEGIDFVENGYRGYPGDQEFTPEEWAELSRLSKLARADWATPPRPRATP